MKIFISNYRHFISPSYKFIDKLHQQEKINENIKNKLDKFVTKLFDLINKIWKKLRIEYIHVDKWDVHSMDITLAKIIHPMLLELKKQDLNYPILGSEHNDCFPEKLQVQTDFDPEFDDDKIMVLRWEYLLEEMIYAFGIISSEVQYNDTEMYTVDNERVQKGLQYFGRFYNSLWN